MKHGAIRRRLQDRREAGLVLLAAAAVAVLMTWPLAAQMAGALPADLGDPLLNTWLLAWAASRLPAGLRGFWDAPIFHPYPGTLAWSEHLLGIALPVAPVQWLAGNPVLAYNVAFLLAYVLAGAGMYLLVRALTGRRDAAAVAAAAFAFTPFRAAHLGHVQVLSTGWMPIALWGLHRYLVHGSRRGLLVFAAGFLLTAFSNLYYLYFFGLTAAVVAIHGIVVGSLVSGRQSSPEPAVNGRSEHRDPIPSGRRLAELALAAALMLAVLAPVGSAYLSARRQHDQVRPVELIRHYSADLASYVQVTGRSTLWGSRLTVAPAERELFVGLTILLLAGTALVLRRREAREAAATVEPAAAARGGLTRVPALALYGGIAVAAVVLSLGPRPAAAGYALPFDGPYAWLLAIVPGLDGVRVPARLGAIVTLALAVLAGIGAARIFERLPRAAAGLAVLIGAAILAEGHARVPVVPFDPAGEPHARAAWRWLAEQPRGGVLELPIGEGPPMVETTLRYQYGTLIHGQPIVNGYSGYGSPLQHLLGAPFSPLHDLEDPGGWLDMLRSIDVRYILVHHPWFGEAEAAALAAAVRGAGPVAEIRTLGAVTVVRLEPPFGDPRALVNRPRQDEPGLALVPPAAFFASASHNDEALPAAIDGDLATRWTTLAGQRGAEWIELRFDRPRRIARIRLEQGNSPGDYPARLRLEAGDGPLEIVREGTVLTAFAAGLLRDPRAIPIDLDLPGAPVTRVRLVQTGTRGAYWSVHRLTVWEAGSIDE
jgi:hypothetical protein